MPLVGNSEEVADVETIDDQIAADWAEIQAKHAEPEAAPSETPTEPVVTEAPRETKPRDEQGKFAKADAVTPVKTETAPIEPAEPEASSAPQRDINRPPSTWKPQARQDWNNLPQTVRAEIHRREGDFQNGQAQLLPDARLGSEMRKVTEPYRMVIESNYGTPEKAMNSFLATAASLQMGSPQQKLQTIVGIAQQFGVDLSALNGESTPDAPQQPYSDPRVDQLLQQMQRQDQERQTAEQSRVEMTATQWMNQKDQQGNPVRPFVNDVMSEMAVLIPQIKQQNPLLDHAQVLDQAYDRAVWANPDVRTVLQGQKQSELQQQQQTESQLRVQNAKRAASVNVARRASTPSPAKPGSIEDTLKATARELGLIS